MEKKITFRSQLYELSQKTVLELYNVHISYDNLRQNLLINSLIEIKKIAIRGFHRKIAKNIEKLNYI